MTVDAHYAYPLFPDSVAGDASSSVGWGVCVGPFIAFGRWADSTKAALKNVKSVLTEQLKSPSGGMVKLSISPAELFVANLVLRLVFRVAKDKLRGSSRIVGRCDNSSACHAVNKRRARSVPMHTGVMMVTETERVTSLRMRLEHIPTEENVVPDLLSRGRIEEAKAILVKRWGYVVGSQFESGFVEKLENRLCNSCLPRF